MEIVDFPLDAPERCSFLTYRSRDARRSRFERQPTDPASAGRRYHYMREAALGALVVFLFRDHDQLDAK